MEPVGDIQRSGRHHFVAVDFPNLMDAFGTASERGGRVRLSDTSRVEEFLRENALEKDVLQRFSAEQRLPNAGILSQGLMKGFYFYCLETERAYLCLGHGEGLFPLRVFSRDMQHTLTISYACEDLATLALPLQRELERRGISTYLLDFNVAPAEPLWGIRFREAAFHSRYFVPLLTATYLARRGSMEELFDFARSTVAHRGDEFFYPLIPLVRDLGELSGAVFRERSEIAGTYDAERFEWVRTHLLVLSLGDGFDALASFFGSLESNSRGRFDSGYLDFLTPRIEFVEPIEQNGKRWIVLSLSSPVLTFHCFVLGQEGVARYLGMGEPSAGAKSKGEIGDPREFVVRWLGLDRASTGEPVRNPASEPSPDPGPPVPLPERLFCSKCQAMRAPKWRPIPNYEELLSFGGKSRYGPVMALCPACGAGGLIER